MFFLGIRIDDYKIVRNIILQNDVSRAQNVSGYAPKFRGIYLKDINSV